MSNSQSVQEIFKSEQHFWCHEGNKHIADWVTINAQDHPNLYATFLNDSNAVMYRKRMGKPTEHDERMRSFLERYPMTYTEVVEAFIWYKANILDKKDFSGVGPHMTGLIDVRTYGKLLTLRGT